MQSKVLQADVGKETARCPPKSALQDRPPLSRGQARDLMRLFKIMASDTRLRLLHALVRSRELCVGEICEAVGMKPQAVSNQLQRLSEQGIVASRKEGLQVFYCITDPCVAELLDRGLCLMEDARERTR